jgi:hypothetical protein
MKVLSCFALKLDFTPDFFTECHDPLSSEYQSTLRLLHYLPMTDAKPEDFTGSPGPTSSRCPESSPAILATC